MRRGSCYGFEVHSDLAFTALRDGAGEALSVVCDDRLGPDGDLVIRWEPPRVSFRADLYRMGRAWRLWIERAGWFHIDPDEPRITMPTPDDHSLESRVLGLPALLCFLARGRNPLHAAAVDVGGTAVLVGAPSRFGKTTLAAALASAGHRVLSEDLACLDLAGAPSVIPGPAMLRLRHDVASLVAPDDADVIAVDEDRLHMALAPATRGTCDPVPLAAVVLLREHEGPARLESVDAADAVPDLWALSFHLPDRDDLERCFDAAVALAGRVPVFDLYRETTLQELPAVVDAVGSLAGSRV